jgi:phage recombination protein Bet
MRLPGLSVPEEEFNRLQTHRRGGEVENDEPTKQRNKVSEETKDQKAVAVKTAEERGLAEYVPLGSSDAIKLSVAIVRNLVCVPTKSGQLCSERDALRFIALCKAQRLNPFAGDCYLMGYDGKEGPEFSMVVSAAAFFKRAETNPHFDGVEGGVIVTDGEKIEETVGEFVAPGWEIVGAWAKVHCKNLKVPFTNRVNLNTYRRATRIWDTHTAPMIVKCAKAGPMRQAFPSSCGELYLQEEMGATEHTPKFTVKAPDFGQTALPEAEPKSLPAPKLGERKVRKKAEPEPEPVTVNVEPATDADAEMAAIERGNK